MEMKGKQTWSFAEERAGRNSARLSTALWVVGTDHFIFVNIFLIFYTKHSFYCAKLLCMMLCVGTSVVSLVAEGRQRAGRGTTPTLWVSKFHLASGSGKG